MRRRSHWRTAGAVWGVSVSQPRSWRDAQAGPPAPSAAAQHRLAHLEGVEPRRRADHFGEGGYRSPGHTGHGRRHQRRRQHGRRSGAPHEASNARRRQRLATRPTTPRTTPAPSYVFVRNGANWAQQAYRQSVECRIGRSLRQRPSRISADGSTMAVSAALGSRSAATGDQRQPGRRFDPAGRRRMHVFTRNGTHVASEQAYLKASNTGEAGEGDDFGDGDQFGFSVAAQRRRQHRSRSGRPARDSGATGINGNQADNSAAVGGRRVRVRAHRVHLGAAGLHQGVEHAQRRRPVRLRRLARPPTATRSPSAAYDEGGRRARRQRHRSEQTRNGSGAVYVFARTRRHLDAAGATSSRRTRSGCDSLRRLRCASATTATRCWRDRSTRDCLRPGMHSRRDRGVQHRASGKTDSSGAAYVFVRGGSTWTQQAS